MEFKEKMKLTIPEAKVLEVKPGQSYTLSSRQMGNSVSGLVTLGFEQSKIVAA